MIEFEKVRYRNFLGVGDKEIVINLKEAATTLVVGKNGAGKSTLLDAISFVLFGKAHRAINKPQLINSINGKDCEVEIWFNVNGRSYRVLRTQKPWVFEIYRDGKLVNQDSHSRDYQKYLEQQILGLNHKTFHQVVVLGSGNFTPFMQLVPHSRRAVVEELLDASIYGKMSGVHKEEFGKILREIDMLESSADLLNQKIRDTNKHITSLRKVRDTNSAAQAKKIGEITQSITKLNDKIAVLNDKIGEEELGDVSINRIRADIRKIERLEVKLESTMGQYEEHKKSDGKCSSCGQHLPNDVVEKRKSTATQKIKELSTALDDLKARLSKKKKELDEVSRSHDRIKSHTSSIAQHRALIRQLESDRSALEKETGVVDKKDIEKEEAALRSYIEENQQNQEKLRKLQTRKKYSEAISEILKDGGIKSCIIKRYLPAMNKLINKYLSILEFFVLFHLDEDFKETIKSRHCDEYSYGSFSEGEKQRIDLSLLFAWRAIAKMKNSVNTNLLILDETFDSSLDAEGVENLLKILSTLSEETRIFVISHKRELLEGRMERKLEFTKTGNFTTMSVSD